MLGKCNATVTAPSNSDGYPSATSSQTLSIKPSSVQPDFSLVGWFKFSCFNCAEGLRFIRISLSSVYCVKSSHLSLIVRPPESMLCYYDNPQR